jgi:YceI-like domain
MDTPSIPALRATGRLDRAAGSEQTFQATGDLTMHGTTRSVTFKLNARYTGSAIQIAGSIPVTFADWNIPNPSFGPVSIEDHGILEFAVNFAQA